MTKVPAEGPIHGVTGISPELEAIIKGFDQKMTTFVSEIQNVDDCHDHDDDMEQQQIALSRQLDDKTSLVSSMEIMLEDIRTDKHRLEQMLDEQVVTMKELRSHHATELQILKNEIVDMEEHAKITAQNASQWQEEVHRLQEQVKAAEEQAHAAKGASLQAVQEVNAHLVSTGIIG